MKRMGGDRAVGRRQRRWASSSDQGRPKGQATKARALGLKILD